MLDEHDVLVHHPYESFATSVEAFVAAAADDADVLAIKQTLYRTGDNSPIVAALVRASQAGKQVTVVVELQARFDERTNIGWARTLEEAGVQVIYGLVTLKTHSKISLVVRREGDRIRRYCHIGSGNYNSHTARIYEDVGLMTADPDIGADVGELFNLLTGSGDPPRFRRLVVSPVSTREYVLEAIDAEAAGRRGRAGSSSRPTGSPIRGSSTPSTGRRRPASRWTSSCGDGAASDPACPVCPRGSGSAPSWAATSSTRGSSASAASTAGRSGYPSGPPT